MILVTGGTGLVGSHLLYKLLKRGEAVRATKRATSSLNDVALAFSFYGEEANSLLDKIEWVEVDLNNPAAVDEIFEGVKKVFHCAAMVSFNPKDKDLLIQQNPTITANLINSALSQEVEHFAHVSSVAAIGRKNDPNQIIEEDFEWKNSPHNSNYAIGKYLSELEVWRGMEEGLNAAIVNPTIILGAGNWHHSSNAIFRRFSNHFKFYTTGQNGFVDVRDVVDALLILSDKNISSERFILVGKNKTYKELTSKIAIAFGNEPPNQVAKKWITAILWRLEKIRGFLFKIDPLITKETARSSASNWVYSNKKAQDVLGLEFREIDNSIQEFVAFYKKANGLG